MKFERRSNENISKMNKCYNLKIIIMNADYNKNRKNDICQTKDKIK